MLQFLMYLGGFVALIGAAIFLARMIFTLPDISGRKRNSAIPATADTRLGDLMLNAAVAHPGKSGVTPLASGRDALFSRLALIATAEQSIDAQYYIWHDDTSGILLLDALYHAARRGVRIRLLLDDNGIPGLDPFLAALTHVEGLEIRLFNPSTLRNPKQLCYAYDFMRMNRRMHNKSLIVDGAMAIVGGRNIGDEYFRVGNEPFFFDLDVLATGAIVPETADTFDQYWNSASVFAMEQIVKGRGDMDGFLARVAKVKDSPEAADVLKTTQADITRYTPNLDELEWTKVSLVADDPCKGLGTSRRDQLMITRLGEILGVVSTRLDLVSAYFVPGKQGTNLFSDLAQSGIELRVLTNSMNTTDVVLVHAGYAKYRRPLLKAGVNLYELKLCADRDAGEEEQILPFGLSGASMHAKTFAVDGSRIFIGSFNFDPRSAMLNCEMGFLIESPHLAQNLSESFDSQIDSISYRPRLTPEGKMIWHETDQNGTLITYHQEPEVSWLQQAMIAIIRRLPVEWLL